MRLRDIRERQNLTLREVEKRMNGAVHYSTIARWERSNQVPRQHRESLAAALGVPESELRNDPPPDSEPEGPTPQVVKSRAAQGEWMAAVIQKEEDRDLAWVLAAIGSLVDPDAWVASITMAQIEEQSGNPEVFRAVWDEVLKSPWLKRIGEAEYVFQLVFPVEEE